MTKKRDLQDRGREYFFNERARQQQQKVSEFTSTLPPFWRDFEDYVSAFPEGESYRRWVTNDGRARAFLILGESWHGGLPPLDGHSTYPRGVYMWGRFTSPTRIIINDCDDGLLEKEYDTEEQAREELEEIFALAPLSFKDLIEVFGFRS